jgi:hypothetical protein
LDSAFQSRIDIVFHFTELSKSARRQVWEILVNQIPERFRDVDGADFDTLSNWEHNGREIKSAIKTSLILAKSEDTPLRLDRLKVVLQIRKATALSGDVSKVKGEKAAMEHSNRGQAS